MVIRGFVPVAKLKLGTVVELVGITAIVEEVASTTSAEVATEFSAMTGVYYN